MFNMFSPVQFNLDGGPGRDLLFRSNFDLRTSVLSYNGIDMRKNNKLRSEFQRLIGKQNVEAELDKLAKDPKMIRSIQQMEADLRAGDQGNDPMKYPHNLRIKRVFDKAKKKAWAQMRLNEDVKLLIQKQKEKKAAEYQRKQKINNAPTAVELSNYPH
jgi:Fe-S cluster biosynthesis and repair protein YggX